MNKNIKSAIDLLLAVAKYVLPLGKPFLNNNYVITALTCMMVIQLDAHKSVIMKVHSYK